MNQVMTGKRVIDALPHNQQAERQLLACILVDPNVLRHGDVASVRHTDYFDPDLQQVAYAIDRLRDDGKPIVARRMAEMVDAAGGVRNSEALFREIALSIGTTNDVRTYAEIISENARRRRQLQLAQEIERQVGDGMPPEDIDGLLSRYLDHREHLPGSFNPFNTLSCDELEATPDEEYLVNGCIVRNQANMFGGPPKAFKTTLAVDMALSMATAGYFAGYFKCPRAIPVLFMSEESGLSTLRKTAKSIAKAAGIDWPNVPNLRFSTMLPKFGIDDEIKRLDATFKANPFECLFIDPLYKCFGSTDSGNMFAAGELLMHFGSWCESNSVTLVLLHHLKKSVQNPYEPADLQDFSWAGFAKHARSWLLISRREKYTPPGAHKLWLAIGGSAGHGGLWALDIDQGEFVPGELRAWNLTLQSAAEVQRAAADKKNDAKKSKAQLKIDADVQSLVDTLKQFPDGETMTTIRAKSGLWSGALQVAIPEAIQRGLVVSCEVVKGGRKAPREGYRLSALTDHREHREESIGRNSPDGTEHREQFAA